MAEKAFADFRQASTPADGAPNRAGPVGMDFVGPKSFVEDGLRKAPRLTSSAREYVSGSSTTVGLKFGASAAVIDGCAVQRWSWTAMTVALGGHFRQSPAERVKPCLFMNKVVLVTSRRSGR